MSNSINNELIEQEIRAIQWWTANGYTNLKKMPDGQWCGLMRLMFTTAVVAGLNSWGYEDRWCYHEFEDALTALKAWNGVGEPKGWHRHPATGRRRDTDGTEYIRL